MVWKPGSKHSDTSSRVIARRNDWNSICALHQGPRSMAASRGRIHDRSPIACRNTKKALAERGPSIHDGENEAGSSYPREGGVSGTPRLIGSIATVPGILVTRLRGRRQGTEPSDDRFRQNSVGADHGRTTEDDTPTKDCGP